MKTKKIIVLVCALSMMAVAMAVAVLQNTGYDLSELFNNANEPVTTDEATTDDVKNCLSLSRLVEGKPGERVKVDLVLSGFEGKCVDTIFLRILNNTDLTFESISGDLSIEYLERDGIINFIFTSGILHEIKDNEVVLSFYFTIPEDAKPGTIYDLEWADISDYDFCFLNSVNSPESYSCNFVDGSVKVVD
ncbi:MAG: hypothetical protein Q4D76_05665 [Oscillospiraceae bacterium]|nr:hypothetical protein [Oscillospiraceae bacterium]